jgi:hypothetical protein
MINNFLNLYIPIRNVIQNSNNKIFKDKKLLFLDKEILYLKNTLIILNIFVKAITKLQAEKYPTIYYILPYIYRIYIQLERIKTEL